MKIRFINAVILFTAVISICGCAKLAHLQELLTLKAMSDESDKIDKYVKEQDRKFGLLLAAVADGSIEDYTTKKQIIKTFGDPVFIRSVQGGTGSEEWLYRYAKKFFDSEKVYFYFDSNGKLVERKYFEAPKPALKTEPADQ